MRAQHTPGPWVATNSNELITAGKEGKHIAHVVTIGMGYQVAPNAALIAAAPDLLASLEAIIGAYGNATLKGAPELDLARAAIAKAKIEIR